ADAADPGQPLVAVLLDGEGWRSRRTVADRDGLPVEVLKGLMRWPAVERVWLPEWLQQREQTLARLASAVMRAGEVLQLRRLDAENAASSVSEVSVDRTAPVAPARADSMPSVIRSAGESVPPRPRETELRHRHLRQYIEWEPKR